MITLVLELQALGYTIRVDGDRLRLEWQGTQPPPADAVGPRLEALRRHKVAVLAALRCWWCQGSRLLYSGRTGHRYCLDCMSVYNPCDGAWAPGDPTKHHPAMLGAPVTAEGLSDASRIGERHHR